MVKVVFVTCSPDEAVALAHGLVDSGLAACVNQITGITSVYRWEGEVHQDSESLLMIKTNADCVDALRETVQRLHSYETPEFLVLDTDTTHSSSDYLTWVHATLNAKK